MLVRFRLSFWRIPRNAVITGVDSVGLIEAACVTTGQRKLAFLSFEILFDGEVNPKIKQREKRIGNQVRLWLSQDSDRVEALVQENALKNDFAFICPVSPRGAARVVNRRLRDDLGIPSDAKVIAAIGSVAAWTMFPEIAYSVGDWPAGYVLLIHERYGAARARLKELGLDNLELTGRVYVSTYAANHPDEMAYVLAGSTAGLAFYRQQPGHPLLNKNLELLGRSSGKIATLARHGIPIITNAPGFAANDVREFEAGIACESPQDLSRIFMEQDVETFAPGAVRYFEDVLSFDNYQEDFRKRLEILHDSLPTK